MKPCEHCGQAKNRHQKRGRGRGAQLFCPMKTVGIHYHASQTYSQSKESATLDFAAHWKRIGPQPVPKWFTELAPLPGVSYDHKIQTRAGGLQITFYGTWIAACFDDPRTACLWVACCNSTANGISMATTANTSCATGLEF